MGFASWVCRITVNRFVFVSKICHLKVALVSGESNVYFFQTVRSASVIKVDFIIRKEAPYRQQEFIRRCTMEIDDTTLWFVTPEDLLLSKLIWAADGKSEMQLNDVRNLILEVAALDWDYIEFWATELQVEAFLREVRE